MPLKTLIICPAYNEEKRIGHLLEQLNKKLYDVLVINDGSVDNTARIVKKYKAKIINHENNQGKGAALRTGIQYFLTQNYELAIFIDADGQHNPNHIPKFIKIFSKYPDIDVLVASRFGTDQWINSMPFLRKISNLLSRFGIWVLYNGFYMEDPQNGYRAYRKNALEVMEFETSGYEAETEMIIEAYLKGFKFGTLHIESIYEDDNTSKFSILMDTWKIPKVMVKNFFVKRPFILRTLDRKLKYRRYYKKAFRKSVNRHSVIQKMLKQIKTSIQR